MSTDASEGIFINNDEFPPVGEKSLFETVDDVEQQYLQLNRAKAVLIEITRYFENKIEPNTTMANMFVEKMEHISILLYLLFDLLHSTELELSRCIEEMLKHCKEV